MEIFTNLWQDRHYRGNILKSPDRPIAGLRNGQRRESAGWYLRQRTGQLGV